MRHLIATKHVKFLFGEEIVSYSEKLFREAINLHFHKQVLDTNQTRGVRDPQEVDRWNQGVLWFTDQIEEIERIFAKYLKITG